MSEIDPIISSPMPRVTQYTLIRSNRSTICAQPCLPIPRPGYRVRVPFARSQLYDSTGVLNLSTCSLLNKSLASTNISALFDLLKTCLRSWRVLFHRSISGEFEHEANIKVKIIFKETFHFHNLPNSLLNEAL